MEPFQYQIGNSLRYFRDEADVLVSTEVGGEGRNLQFCNGMVNFDLPWNPMAIEQRIGRIHRIGQSREVFVYNLAAQNTLEHHMLNVLDRKKAYTGVMDDKTLIIFLPSIFTTHRMKVRRIYCEFLESFGIFDINNFQIFC